MSKISGAEDIASEAEPKKDDPGALFTLGMRCSIGRDVEHDPVAAHKWFNLAAMMGHDGALEARAELAREMTAEQVADAQRQARAWLWSRNSHEAAKSEAAGTVAVVRPLYLRRKTDAMRSGRAFARVVA
jgi:TPR repeat protein